MKSLLFLCALLPVLASVSAGEYHGHVGKLDAVFSLDWQDDGTVTGTYSYPDRPGKTYRLAGTNPREGVLILDEFTGKKKTARCKLTKKLTGDQIIWVGKMFNRDGRVFEMSFRRLREVTSEPEPMQDELPSVEFGNPQIPVDLEERLLAARKRAETLATGDGLDADLFGELHYGWVAPGHLTYGEDPDREIPRWQADGQMIWAAIRILEKEVELQFETPDGHRHVLTGEVSDEGVLRLQEGGTDWELHHLELGNAVVWTGATTRGPERSLLVYRPRDAIYYGRWIQMEDIAPGACLWLEHSWGRRFHERRFPFVHGKEVEARVSRIVEQDGGVARVECQDGNGTVYEAAFDSIRDMERIPAVVGMPVYLMVEGSKIRRLLGMWHVISWRGAPGKPVEFQMFPTEMADLDRSSLEPIRLTPAVYGNLPKRILRPDYFGQIDWHCWVNWYVVEDVVAWPLPGDEGAGMLELESIALEEPGAALPWNPATTPIPFPTRQHRVGEYNFTTGYGSTLPGNR
ncbi:MAG: hypothetical protein P1U87_04600 [Verrucomicrobiales bacterium]|nr:hypothetical protein [Verrucomicrobiales bacterium]